MPNYEWEKADSMISSWEVDDLVAPYAWEQRDPISKTKGFIRGFIEYPEEKLPIIGQAVKSAKAVRVFGAFQRITEGYDYSEPISPETLMPGAMGIKPALYTTKEKDIEDIENYFIRLNEDYTTLGKTGRIASEIPAFIFDFMITGGARKLGTVAAKTAVRKILGRYVTTAAGRAALATSGFAIGTAARAAGMPHRAVNSILQRQIPEDIQISEDGGEIKITGTVEPPMTSLWKGLADHWIEVASEEAGEVIAPFVSKYFKKMPLMGKFTGALQQRWLKLHPGKTVSDFTKKILRPGGFHGVVMEVGEEYLGDITRGITDVDDFGADAIAQEKYGRDANMLERVSAGVRQDNENLVPMLLAFSIPGAIGKGADAVDRIQAKRIQKRQKESQEKYDLMMELAEEAAEAGETISFEKFEEEANKYRFDVPGIGTMFTPKWLVHRMLGLETLLEDTANAEMARKLEQQNINAWVDRLIPRLKKEKDLARLPEILPEEAKKEVVTEEIYPIEFDKLDKVLETVRERKDAVLYKRTQELTGLENPEEFVDYPDDVEMYEELLLHTKAHILQTKIDSKNPIHIMRDLLDTYEDAPAFLTKSEAKIFNEVRELTRYLRIRANLVREKMGLRPIEDVKGYITHWIDATANSILDRDFSIHSGYLYKLMKGLPKRIKNPTALKRKIKKDLNSYFSKDLGKLLKVMAAYDLKDIYLRQPFQAAWEELHELRKERLIPNSTFQAAEKFLLYDIRKHKTSMDKAFNRTVKRPVDFLNKLLPASKIIHDPARNVFGAMSNLQTICGLGFRTRPMSRNLPQRLLLLDLYRTVDYAKAQAVAFRLAKMPIVRHPVSGKETPLIDLIREQDWYKLALNKFAEMDSAISGIGKASLHLYGRTHIGNLFLSNVEVSALTGYFDWLNMYNQSENTESKHFKNCLKQSKRLGVPAEQLLTQESDMLWNIREAVRRTQWEYFNISMPALYRSQFNRAVWKFQSWWMNYFFNHCRECINQISTGRNSLGRLLTPHGRLRAAKGMGTIVAIAKATGTLFGIEMLKYLFFPLPGYLPPIPELVVGLTLFFAADDERERKIAWRRVEYGLKFWIPFSAFFRDLNRLLSGEYSLSDFLFYKVEKPEKKK